jgi:hypothetical protein
MKIGPFEWIVAALFRAINRWRVWYRLPFPLAVTNLLALRIDLRWRNLFDTESALAQSLRHRDGSAQSCPSARSRYPPLSYRRWILQRFIDRLDGHGRNPFRP